MFADAQMETIRREELEILQLDRLKRQVAWAAEKSAFYQRSFKDNGVTPADIQKLSDVRRLPFVTPAQLRRLDASEFLTLPLSGILRINHHDELFGKITNLYTRGDIKNNVEMMIRCLAAANVLKGSIVGIQSDLTDSRFLDVLYALESLGATVIPFGANFRRWMDFMDSFCIDTLVSTPQLVMQLIIQMQTEERNIIDYPLSKVICVNTTNIQNPMQRILEERTSTKFFNLFAPPEIGNAAMLFQCTDGNGQHVQEDHFLFELLKFDSNEVIDENDVMGELVVTTLTAQAVPLIRYRTGQAVRRMSEPCYCGRTFARIATPYTVT